MPKPPNEFCGVQITAPHQTIFIPGFVCQFFVEILASLNVCQLFVFFLIFYLVRFSRYIIRIYRWFDPMGWWYAAGVYSLEKQSSLLTILTNS